MKRTSQVRKESRSLLFGTRSDPPLTSRACGKVKRDNKETEERNKSRERGGIQKRIMHARTREIPRILFFANGDGSCTLNSPCASVRLSMLDNSLYPSPVYKLRANNSARCGRVPRSSLASCAVCYRFYERRDPCPVATRNIANKARNLENLA